MDDLGTFVPEKWLEKSSQRFKAKFYGENIGMKSGPTCEMVGLLIFWTEEKNILETMPNNKNWKKYWIII